MGIKIHKTCEVSPEAIIGEGTQIWNETQLREGVIVGKDCRIGKCVYLDTGVRVGDRCKIQNHATIYTGVTLEDEVFVGPHVVFANDTYPRAISPVWEVVPTRVRKGASLGANATILCGISIGEYAMVGAGSVVTKDVAAHALVMGNPAKISGYVCTCGRRLDLDGRCAHCKKEFTVG